MAIFLYEGGLHTVQKSGIGQAILHQQDMLERAGLPPVTRWRDPSSIIQLNTVLPDSVLAALWARILGKKVVYYGHSTIEDFRNSFHGSNFLAPLFGRWIRFCYSLGDVVLTPTPYSQRLLESYGIPRPVHHISNGIDVGFFAPDPVRRQAFRQAYNLAPEDKVVISVGHYIARKGIVDFIALARRMPQVRFFWFGYTAPHLVPRQILDAIAQAPSNLSFPGFVDRNALRDAYCGADAFVFLSTEETEGIVVLEALACECPTILRDIPVYEGWLENDKTVHKVTDLDGTEQVLTGLLDNSLPDLTRAGRAVAEARSLEAVGVRLKQIYVEEGLLTPLAGAAASAAAATAALEREQAAS